MRGSIVAAVDRSKASHAAAAVAAVLAGALDRRLVLAHVADDPPTFPYGDYRNREIQRKRAATDGYELLARALESMPGVAAETKVAFGAPAEGLLRVCEEEAAGLVVLGSRGRSGLAAVLHGSLSARLPSGSECPVLVVPPGTGEKLVAVEGDDVGTQAAEARKPGGSGQGGVAIGLASAWFVGGAAMRRPLAVPLTPPRPTSVSPLTRRAAARDGLEVRGAPGLRRGGGEPADKRAVGNVGEQGGHQSPAAVVAHQEPRGLQQRAAVSRAERAAHAGMDDREQDAHQCGRGDDPVEKSEEGSEVPAAGIYRGEDRVVHQGEDLSGSQVQQVPECLGARPITSDRGAE